MTLNAHITHFTTLLGGNLTVLSVRALFLVFGMALVAVFASLPFGFDAVRQTAIVAHELLHSELTLIPVVLALCGIAIFQLAQREANLATFAAVGALAIGALGYAVL